MWLSQLNQFHFYDNEAELVGRWIAAISILLGMAAWGTRIYRRARRAAMLPGSALVKKDKRPIVAYLRSFQDDTEIKLRARAANGRILPERLVKIPFEEVVTDHLWGYGPVLAIGNPRARSKRAPLGAARDYVDDSAWQQKVTELIGDAAMIVAVAGGTEGLAWEIDTIARVGSVWKLVLLLPPVGVKKLRPRWQTLTRHGGSNLLPAHIDFARSRAVFFPKGEPALIAGDKGDDWTYEAVLDYAALMIRSERDAIRQPTSEPQRVSRAVQIRQGMGAVAPDLVTLAGGMLGAVLLVFVLGFVEFRNMSIHPFASAGAQRERGLLITKVMQDCRQKNPNLSAEQVAKYCACFANDLADAVTLAEMNRIDFDPSAVQAKARSIGSACSKKTLGR
jgi:hypothetical protein